MDGGAKCSPHSDSAPSSAASTSSRPRSSARAKGPGRMPAPIIIPISMSLAEASSSSRTRQDSTSALSVKRSTSVSVASLAAVLIEPLPGLLTEVPGVHELLHPLGDVEAVAVALVQVLGNVQHGVQAEQVAQAEGPHARRLR